jgi:hypothetical protein
MTPAESAPYSAVEDFIGDVYRAASPEKRSAVGFVMTVYRRRLASSFEALKRTLNGRLMRTGGITEEDASLDETSDEVMSGEEVACLAAEAPEAIDERLSFAYKDTVEQDVFFTVGNRINLFQGIVGRLQPILSRLPRRFEELVLLDRDARDAARQRFLADLEQQVRDADESGFDIDATVEGSLDLPSLPGPALTLRDLDRAIQIARSRPPEVDFQPLDPGSFGISLPGGALVRVTTDPNVFEFSPDNFQLFSPAGDVFGAIYVDGARGGADERGIAWIVQRPGAEAEFVVATRFRPRTVASFEELLAALDVVGEPCDFPLADWPGVPVSVIA